MRSHFPYHPYFSISLEYFHHYVPVRAGQASLTICVMSHQMKASYENENTANRFSLSSHRRRFIEALNCKKGPKCINLWSVFKWLKGVKRARFFFSLMRFSRCLYGFCGFVIRVRESSLKKIITKRMKWQICTGGEELFSF